MSRCSSTEMPAPLPPWLFWMRILRKPWPTIDATMSIIISMWVSEMALTVPG